MPTIRDYQGALVSNLGNCRGNRYPNSIIKSTA